MKPAMFMGSGVAVVTPFTQDENRIIDFDKLYQLIEFQLQNQTDAIIICGTTGEASTMNDDEHLSAIDFAVKTVKRRVPVIAGTGTNDTRHCTALSVEAQRLGVDGLLVVTPYYNKTTQKGLVNHFYYIADRVNIPIMLYNVPSRTNLNIAVPTAKQLSKHQNIVAIKEASGLLDYSAMIARECGEDLQLYAGNDDIILPILSLGGNGVVSVVANMLPKQTHDITDLYFKGDIAASRQAFLKMMPLVKALFIEVNPIPIKTAMNLIGLPAGDVRMPLCEMDDKNKQALIEAMREYGLNPQCT